LILVLISEHLCGKVKTRQPQLVLGSNIPGILKTPGLSLALKMTLPQAAKFVPNVLTPELLEKVEEEFAKLG
jgi:hypothetical protein